jgi:2-alkyl-3-oxoalkanoate reductase
LSNPGRILVTGASGFVGGELTRSLVEQGRTVRALVRPTSDVARLRDLGVELAVGALEDGESLRRAADGCELVFHNAAAVSDWGPAEGFRRVNVDGTVALIEACRAAGVTRLVHTSSLTVLGIPRDGRRVDEETPTLQRPRGAYTATKIEAELRVREANGAGLETVVVRPGGIWGPRDPTLLPRFVELAERGRLFWIGRGDGALGLSHVAHVVDVLMRAGATPAAAGGLFHVADGERVTSRQLFEALAEGLGLPAPRRGVPVAALELWAGLAEATARLLRSPRPPVISRYAVALLACDVEYPIERARQVLGFEPWISVARGVEELSRWYSSAPRP